MKVVILPGPDDEGGPPTLLEIEKIENRYQLQSDGKSEYYGFDRALSIRRKMKMGFSLEEQLRDDPRFSGHSAKELKRVMKQYEKDYLSPLECIDRYLEQFNRQGLYRTISTGISDPEGRWQAFIDYSKAYKDLSNPKKRLELEVEEDEIGSIEDAAFKIIRLRQLKGLPKVHKVMRDLPKMCGNRAAKKELLKIGDLVDDVLPYKECVDKDDNELPLADVDRKWAKKFEQDIIHRVKKATELYGDQKEKETPITLMEAAYKKLTHGDMDIKSIAISDFKKAHQLAVNIKNRADDLESEIYHCEKELKKLAKKK